ncbi:MAG TPA: hypothetical protein PLZ57_02890 [Pseudobdellovibrionaceae bacterium]|nr:hypothetical protein [Pseudobdellovibrionaceae bacterium]
MRHHRALRFLHDFSSRLRFARITVVALSLTPMLLSGCAIMHHTQVGEIDSQAVLKGRRFEILISETGVNFDEAARVGKALTQHQQTRDDIGGVAGIISLFQMGPRTGNQVFSPMYADKAFDLIRKECPRGVVSGLVSIRETAKYPVVSGEIVKIIGYCRET